MNLNKKILTIRGRRNARKDTSQVPTLGPIPEKNVWGVEGTMISNFTICLGCPLQRICNLKRPNIDKSRTREELIVNLYSLPVDRQSIQPTLQDTTNPQTWLVNTFTEEVPQPHTFSVPTPSVPPPSSALLPALKVHNLGFRTDEDLEMS
ncbi:Hypothetical predicted protein [Mytilus galloprovincialis]|uniref:Uncharacterized protein n=1 Tax=Mytilus galloprovincialis TaxID=29158 RepID=A0A8B6FZS2_MYTGA|nr:Hypothetical predicted protein [Mytilus galloprovincialis]